MGGTDREPHTLGVALATDKTFGFIAYISLINKRKNCSVNHLENFRH